MESYDFLLFVAIILLSTKIFSLLSQKVNMPQVVGALLVGVLLGPSCLNILHETDFLTKSAEIGVIFLMFLAGLDTDFDDLKATGKSSVIIAFVGVLIPLGSGFLTYYLFFHGQRPDTMIFLESAFVGIVLTATSVSITVETLREMGKLKGKMGTSILGAAIIDDILGIIALTVITSFTVPGVDIMVVLLKILLFFVFIAVCGFFCISSVPQVGNRIRNEKKSGNLCCGILFASVLYFRSLFWSCRYYRSLFCRFDPLQCYRNKILHCF